MSNDNQKPPFAKNEENWNAEFQEFLELRPEKMPTDRSSAIHQWVKRDIQPAKTLIFLKILILHSVTGTLSLAMCNQFGMNPFKTSFSLMKYFHHFGDSGCMIFCGMLFVGISAFWCSWILRPDELRVLKQSAIFQTIGLGLVSLLVFTLVGTPVMQGMFAFWLVGGIIGGGLSIETVYRLRHHHA